MLLLAVYLQGRKQVAARLLDFSPWFTTRSYEVTVGRILRPRRSGCFSGLTEGFPAVTCRNGRRTSWQRWCCGPWRSGAAWRRGGSTCRAADREGGIGLPGSSRGGRLEGGMSRWWFGVTAGDVRPSRSVALGPALLVMLVFTCDHVLGSLRSVLLIGAVDEPAHLATACLVLVAAQRLEWLRAHPKEIGIVLASAVLIDLDHIPLYAGLPHVALGGRPYSHSLLTVAALLLISAVMPSGRRRWVVAMAAGLGLHLVRDVATGPGVLLVWPISADEVLVPYPAYLTLCLALAVVGTVRLIRGRRVMVLAAAAQDS
jgi:inner membrane protein